MTPEEIKAKELVEKFKEYTEDKYAEHWHDAKACALICVDEIIALLNGDGKSWDINCYWNGEKFISSRDTKDYYQKVKEEIQKL